MPDTARFDAWLDRVHDEHDEFAYRAVYAAYLGAAAGHDTGAGEATGTPQPDGGYVLAAHRAGELRLADDTERLAFAEHVRTRYCGTRHPTMAAWERAQHAGFLEDRWWLD